MILVKYLHVKYHHYGTYILFMDIFNKFLNFLAHKYLYLHGKSSNRSRGALQYQILPSDVIFNLKKNAGMCCRIFNVCMLICG